MSGKVYSPADIMEAVSRERLYSIKTFQQMCKDEAAGCKYLSLYADSIKYSVGGMYDILLDLEVINFTTYLNLKTQLENRLKEIAESNGKEIY